MPKQIENIVNNYLFLDLFIIIIFFLCNSFYEETNSLSHLQWPFTFQIWDSNVFCDSFLGQAKMTVDVNNRTVVLSHQLMGRRRKENEKMPGDVTMEIACYKDLLAV